MTRLGSLLWLVAASWPLLGAAEERFADIRQGTNLALSLSPDDQTLVVDLLGQLWLLPAAGGAAQPLTPAGETARNPRHGPDGRSVVYQRLIDDQWDLWLLDLDTLTSSPLTATPYDEREPDFAADGRSVVFASDQTGHYCLWRLSLDSGVLTQLTEEPGDASFPALSELGQIVYVREQQEQYSLRVLDAAGIGRELVTTRNPLSAPSWRPGGGVIVFAEQEASRASLLKMLLLSEPLVIKPLSSGEDVFKTRASWTSPAEFIYAADGQLWRRGIADVVRHPVHLFAAVAVEAQPPPTDLPALDLGGTHRALGIHAVARAADGRRAVFNALGDLWLDERGRLEQLTDDAYVEVHPTFTPDGESVIFASDRAGTMNLWRLMLARRQLVQLSFGATKAFHPAVSPDGRKLAYLTTEGLGPWTSSKLEVLDLSAGGAPVTLADGLLDPSQPVWDSDGRTLAVLAETAALPFRVAHRYDAASGAKLTEVAAIELSAREDAAGTQIAPELQWSVAAPPPAPYVVQAGRVFDGLRSDYRRHVDIHVEAGRIAAIVSRNTRPLPAKVIDARDATVIPGLIDVHAHHSALAGERLGRAWLAYGVTTVRELTADVPAALERGEAWASGRRLGPRLVITPSTDAQLTADAAASPVPVRIYPGLADGFGHSLLPQARNLRIPNGRQVPSAGSALAASGPRYELEISPAFVSYQDSLSRVVASATVTGSALGAIRGLAALPAALSAVGREYGYRALFDLGEQQHWDSAGLRPEAVPALEQTLARLLRAGGRVAIGTDAPAVPYGLGVHLELALLAQAGVPNDQALRLATAEGAMALGLESQLGTLEDGKLADFVVLDGDPLARIADSLTIIAVVKGGQWHERATLLAGAPP